MCEPAIHNNNCIGTCNKLHVTRQRIHSAYGLSSDFVTSFFYAKNRCCYPSRVFQLRGKNVAFFFAPGKREISDTLSTDEEVIPLRAYFPPFLPFSLSLFLFFPLDLYSRSRMPEREETRGGREWELNKSNKKLINKEEKFSLALSKLPVFPRRCFHPLASLAFLRMSPRTPVAVLLSSSGSNAANRET